MRRCAKSVSTLLLIAVASATQAQQEPLGRLFFTPEQRATLDNQRQRNMSSTQFVDEVSRLTYNGHVTRSSGRNTTWINGVPMDEREARTLTPTPLRPGETLLGHAKKERTDVISGGTIQINRNTNSASR